jgi:hypothetical protein
MSQANQQDINKYRGHTYARLVRVSDAGDKQASDEAQLAYLKTWADEREMIHAKDYVSNNLSGSLPGNRHDLTELLADAEKNLFRYVLSQRVDRATRGGADHLFWLEFELKKRGVRVLYPGDGLPEGVPFEQTLRAAKADAANETAMSTSQRSAQGGQWALENRRVSPHSRTPFGCYRLYCRSDNTPLFVIVDLRDGRQEKRTWPDLTLIDSYGMVGGGSVGHYRKQKSELVYLVPGDPYEIETVRMMFRLRYIDRVGLRKIARILNDLGRPAPNGGKWAQGQVESIINNEDYTGRGVANRKSSARYNRRAKGAPQKVDLDDRTATTADHIPPITRPMDEWFEDGEPYMLEFLGDHQLREVADHCQRRHWERKLDPTWTRKNKRKHVPSPYLLWPLLKAKQDGGAEPLVGSISGRPGHPVPIYRHKRGAREATTGSIWGRTFNANALHRAVLDVLNEILRDWDDLESRLRAHVVHHIQTLDHHDEMLTAKRQQRDEVRDQLLLYVRSLNRKTQADLAPEIARLEAQRDSLDVEIEGLQRRQKVQDIDPDTVVTTLRQRMQHLADEINTLPIGSLIDVLNVLTAQLNADMETKNVEFAFHLPSWMAMDMSGGSLTQLCMRTSSESSACPGTQHDLLLFIPLANGNCSFVQQQRSVACRCKRSRTAA